MNTKAAVTYTPGPWRQQILIVQDERGGQIAHCTRWEGATPYPEVAEANARLIAAAPDLLAAARAALAYDEAIHRRGFMGEGLKAAPGLPGALAEGDDLDALYFDWQSKASAAIAKAEGR